MQETLEIWKERAIRYVSERNEVMRLNAEQAQIIARFERELKEKGRS